MHNANAKCYRIFVEMDSRRVQNGTSGFLHFRIYLHFCYEALSLSVDLFAIPFDFILDLIFKRIFFCTIFRIFYAVEQMLKAIVFVFVKFSWKNGRSVILGKRARERASKREHLLQ